MSVLAPGRLLLAGATIARWGLHPRKNDTFARRTEIANFSGAVAISLFCGNAGNNHVFWACLERVCHFFKGGVASVMLSRQPRNLPDEDDFSRPTLRTLVNESLATTYYLSSSWERSFTHLSDTLPCVGENSAGARSGKDWIPPSQAYATCFSASLHA